MENWAILALAVLSLADDNEASMQGIGRDPRAGPPLAAWRCRSQTCSALRALVCWREGDLNSRCGPTHWPRSSLRLTSSAWEYVVLAVSAAVLAGLDLDGSSDSGRQLIDRSGLRYDTEFLAQARSFATPRARYGPRPETMQPPSRCCAAASSSTTMFLGLENPAVVPWRSAAALSLAELGRHEEARALAAEELRSC